MNIDTRNYLLNQMLTAIYNIKGIEDEEAYYKYESAKSWGRMPEDHKKIMQHHTTKDNAELLETYGFLYRKLNETPYLSLE